MTLVGKIDDTPGMTMDEVLEKIPLSIFHWRMLLMCGLGFMADSMEVNLLSFLSTCAGDEWNLPDDQIAAISGVVFAGIVIGSLFWGSFADKYGRRPTFILSCFLISIGGFLSGVSPNFAWLIFFRTSVGFGIGGANVPFDLLAELLPAEHRGSFLMNIEYFWTIGSLFVTGVAWATLTSDGWRVLAYITAVPVALTSIFSVAYLPESPRWLLLKGKREKAEKIMLDIAKESGVTLPPFHLVDDKPGHSQEDASYWDLVKTKEVRKISLPLWTVWAMFGFAYYGLILFVGRIYDHSSTDDGGETKCDFNYQSIFINATSEVAGVFIGSHIIDILGRVQLQQMAYGIGGVAVLLMGAKIPDGAVLGVSLIGRMSAMIASSGTWVITPELYPTEMRTTGHAVGNTCSKMAAFIAPFFVISSVSRFGVGIFLCVLNFVAVFACCFLPETKGGKSIERALSMDPHEERASSRQLLSDLLGGDGDKIENNSEDGNPSWVPNALHAASDD